MLDRRAQVGETMTWIVATIVIIVILVISIYIAGASGIAKKAILGREFEIKGHNDLLVTKSFVGYLLTKEEGEIENVFGQMVELNENERIQNIIINPDLAKKIFKEIYNNDYPDNSWMGFILVQGSVKGKLIQTIFPNTYFGDKEGEIDNLKSYYYDEVWLDKEGKIGLELIRKD